MPPPRTTRALLCKCPRQSLRTFISLASILRSNTTLQPPSIPTTTTTTTTKPTPFSKLNNPDEQELYDDFTVKFLDRLRATDNAAEAWEDYSKLVENTLEKFNLSILSHHRLFKMLQGTPAPNHNESKALALSTIVRRLASSANAEEYERLIQVHVNKNDPQKIQSLIAEMRKNGIRPTVKVYNYLIQVYILNNDVPGAMTVFDKLPTEDLDPDVHTYSLLIRGHLSNSSYVSADRLFREMRALGMTPHIFIYNALMLSLVRRGRNAAALRLFDDLQNTPNITPNIATYRLRVAAYANSSNPKAAKSVLDEMLNQQNVPKPDYAVWRTVIRAFIGVGDLEGAIGILRHMRWVVARSLSEGIAKPGSDIYASIISLACEKNEIHTAEVLYEELLSDGLRPTAATWNTLIAFFSRVSHYKTALNIYRNARKNRAPSEVDALGELVRACIAAKKLDAALMVARDVVRPGASIPKSMPSIVERIVCPVVEGLTATTHASQYDQATTLVHDTVQISQQNNIKLEVLDRLYASLMKGCVGWAGIYSHYKEYVRYGGHTAITGKMSDLVLRLACEALRRPSEVIVEMIKNEDVRPSVGGWVQVIDSLLDSGRKDELRLVMEGLNGVDSSAAKMGRGVLGMVLGRLDGRAEESEREEEGDPTWEKFGREGAEEILALIARRVGVSVHG